MSLSFFLTCFCLLVHVQAQNVAIPSSWRDPTIAFSVGRCVNISQSAIDTVSGLFNATGQLNDVVDGRQIYFYTFQNANFLGAIALHDLIAGGSANQPFVEESLLGLHEHLSQPRRANAERSGSLDMDSLTWAVVAMYAYRAYRNQTFLDLATSIWEQENQRVITDADAASGMHPDLTVDFMSECNGASVAGGLFISDRGSTNTLVFSEAVGEFATLSSYLYEATNSSQYASAVQRSAQFLQSQLYNGSVIVSFVNLTGCARSNRDAHIHETGLLVESLSVYLNATADQPNGSLQGLLNQVVTTSISFKGWTDPDGINNYNEISPSSENVDRGRRSVYMRSLYEAWSRDMLNSSLKNLVRAYISVQFNALIDLASTSGTNEYSVNWNGPPPTELQPWGQMEALDTLNSAIGLVAAGSALSSSSVLGSPSSTSGATAPPAPTSSTRSSSHTSKTKTILAVAIVIPLVLLCLVVTLLFLRFRRLKGSSSNGGVLYVGDEYPARTGITQVPGTPPTVSRSSLAEYVPRPFTDLSSPLVVAPSKLVLSGAPSPDESGAGSRLVTGEECESESSGAQGLVAAPLDAANVPNQQGAPSPQNESRPSGSTPPTTSIPRVEQILARTMSQSDITPEDPPPQYTA